MGKTVRAHQNSFLSQLFYAASLLYILAICAAKCSMFLLVARLTRFKSQVMASHILTGLIILWGIAAVFAAAFQCGLPAPWDSRALSKCSSLVRHPHVFVRQVLTGPQFARWAAIEALSMFIEALICALAIWLVWSLQMAMSLKAIVVGAFMMRLLVIIPCTFRLVLLRKDIPSPDSTFSATNVAIVTQVAMHYTVMAATFPCMRSFLQAFDSGLGATTGLETGAYANGSKYGTNRSDSDYALKSIDKNGGNFRAKPEKYRADKVTSTTTTITAPGHQQTEREQARRTRSKSLGSDESKQPIITKTQEWEVRHERRDLN
jgi:hypothetical protein